MPMSTGEAEVDTNGSLKSKGRGRIVRVLLWVRGWSGWALVHSELFPPVSRGRAGSGPRSWPCAVQKAFQL